MTFGLVLIVLVSNAASILEIGAKLGDSGGFFFTRGPSVELEVWVEEDSGMVWAQKASIPDGVRVKKSSLFILISDRDFLSSEMGHQALQDAYSHALWRKELQEESERKDKEAELLKRDFLDLSLKEMCESFPSRWWLHLVILLSVMAIICCFKLFMKLEIWNIERDHAVKQ